MSIPLNTKQFRPAGREVEVSLDALHPTQADLRPEKVEKLMRKSADSVPSPFISAQGATHDGHHRVAAALMRGERKIKAVVL